MSEQQRAQLQEAYNLIKSGQKQAATRLLLNILKADRNSADGWWLLANATSDPAKQRQALTQVLRIKPDHNAALRMLEKVNVAASMPPKEPPAPAAPATSPFTAPPDAIDDPFAAPSQSAAPADDPFGDPFAATAPRSTAQDDFGDPFGEQRTRVNPRAPEPDPFGDPFGATSTQTRGRAADDPFGDPFAAPSQSAAAADDPFGDPFAVAAEKPKRGGLDDDPFGDPFAVSAGKPKRGALDDPFADPTYIAPERAVVPPPKKKGANPLVIVLAIIGIIVVIGCGLFALTAVAGINIFNQVVQTALPEGTFQAAMEELQDAMTALPRGTFEVDDNGIIGNIVEKGAIGFTTPINAVLEGDGFTNHAYKFTGEAGQDVTIELTAGVDDFDVKLTLLGPDGRAVASNDDIDFQNNNLNSRIETTLPVNGAYTVVVSDVGFGGGPYELVLSQ